MSSTEIRNKKIIEIFSKIPEDQYMRYLERNPEYTKMLDSERCYDEDIVLDFFDIQKAGISPLYQKMLYSNKITGKDKYSNSNQKIMTYSYLAFSHKEESDFDKLLEKSSEKDSLLKFLCLLNGAIHNIITPAIKKAFTTDYDNTNNILNYYIGILDMGSQSNIKKKITDLFNHYKLKIAINI